MVGWPFSIGQIEVRVFLDIRRQEGKAAPTMLPRVWIWRWCLVLTAYPRCINCRKASSRSVANGLGVPGLLEWPVSAQEILHAIKTHGIIEIHGSEDVLAAPSRCRRTN